MVNKMTFLIVVVLELLGVLLIVKGQDPANPPFNLKALQERMKLLTSLANRPPNMSQMPNMDNNPLANQNSNQNPNQNSNQNPNQDSNQNPNQNSNQNPNQNSNQNPNQNSNQNPSQNSNAGNSEHELPPNAAARYLVATFGDDIKKRAKGPLGVKGDAQEKELMEAEIQVLSFITFKEVTGPLDIYYMRVIIGKTYIFHIKMSVEYGKGTKLFGLDGKHDEPKYRNRYTVMQVLGPKDEYDRLDKAELA